MRADLAPENLGDVLFEHAEETAFLWSLRQRLVRAPDVTLRRLEALDDRLAAHVDGLRVAGEPAWRVCQTALASEQPGAMFAAAVLAAEAADRSQLQRLLALAETISEMRPGLVAALGWVSQARRRAVLRTLFTSASPHHRAVAITACAAHRIDPGATLARTVEAAEAPVRAAALLAAGVLGRTDLLPACARGLTDGDAGCRFAAARAALLLGERREAPALLQALSAAKGPFQRPALELSLKVLAVAEGRALVRDGLSSDPDSPLAAVKAAGDIGDPAAVPELVRSMAQPDLARAAGEAFTLITGVNLTAVKLDRPPPEDFNAGPNDDPRDGIVALDEDADLPWPDPDEIGKWWRSQEHRFAVGIRHFVGRPVTKSHCATLLRDGLQRQRAASALHLALLEPGSPLFPIDAPAQDQRRRLSR